MSVDESKMEPLPTAVAESPPSQTAAAAAVTEPTVEPQPPPASTPSSTPASSGGVRIRPKICDVRNCDSNSLRNPEILFVCIPGHSYPERRFVWLTLMQAARDKKRSYCCSRHFKVPDDFKDFQEFINAPPGYKRQLTVKKGVVPHLNMPPLNMSALPPLTNRWPMTLPAGLTEEDQLRQNAARAAMPPPPRGPPQHHSMNISQMSNVPNRCRIRYCKGVQTDPPGATASPGPRKVAPSLQYCRLCFKRQDLEPIFTGDQTLIEPDLIDKIFGCTEVRISVESDFPSSICTGCYTSVQEFVKFRKLVQQNDQSLRGIPLPPMATTPTRSPSHGTPTTSVRTKTTDTIPPRPALRVTPIRPVSSVSPVRRPDDPLLEVQRVENVERYQRRQETIERNQPLRAQRMQDTLYPIPYRRPVPETTTSDDPLARAEGEEKPALESESSSTAPEGVQLNDRIVPVTLIRVQPEATGSNEDVELHISNTGQSENKSEDVTVKTEEPEEHEPANNSMNTIRAKPLHQLMAGPEQRKQTPPSVLQAVKLLPSATAKALANQKSSLKPISTLTRGITSGRFVHRIWKPVYDKGTSKQPIGRIFSKSLTRAVRFPGTMTTLFSGSRKHHKPSAPSESPNSGESPRPAEIPAPRKASTPSASPKPVDDSRSSAVSISQPDQRKPPTPSPSPKPIDGPRPAAFSISQPDQRKPLTPSGNAKLAESPKAAAVSISYPGQRKPPTFSGSPKPVESPRPAAVPISQLDQRKPSTSSESPKPAEIRKIPGLLKSYPGQRKPPTLSGSPKPDGSPKPAAVPTSQPDPREPKPIEKPQVLKEKTLPVKSTAPSPVPKPKVSTPTVPQQKQKENSIPATPRDSTPNKPTAPAAKLPVKPAAPSPVRNPPHNAKQTETSPAPPAPSSDGPPPSPRSSRVRKVPLKFQDGVGFAMPKTVNIKAESESQESPKEPPVRITRRSNAAEEKASESRPPAKPERKQPAVTADDAKNKQSKEGEAPKKEPAVVVVRLTRSIEAENKKSEEQQKTRMLKRKSDTRPDPVPPSKSPKVEQKRNSLDTSKTKQQQQKLKQEEQQQKQEQLQKKQQQEQLQKKKQEQEQQQKKQQQQEQLQKKQQQQEQLQKKKQQQEQLQKKQQQEQMQKKQQQEQLQKKQQQEQLQKKQEKERLQKKLQQQEQMKKQRHLLQLKKQKHEQQLKKQRQEQRVNGSRKDVPAAEVKKPKEPEPSIPPPVSSQDWKCPFCPDRVFDQKKRLVKHLRKRHGMDYALVRQRLAIYGGNWR